MSDRPSISAPFTGLAMINGIRQMCRRIGTIICTQRPWRFAAAFIIAAVAFFGLTDARRLARAAAPATQPGRAVSISLRMFTVDPARLPGLGILNVDGAAVKLENLDLDAFRKAAGADPDARSQEAKVIDGRKATLFVGSTFSYVADLIPAIQLDGTTSYKAKIGTLDDGLNWSVLPTIGSDSQVTLDMQINISKLKEFKKVSWHNQPNAQIQVPIIESRSIDLNIAIADGQSAVVTGLDDDKKTILFIITPRIVPPKP